MFSNVSSTRNIVFPIGRDKIVFKDYSANINNASRFVRANGSQKMFPSFPHWENDKTDDKTSTGNNVFVTVFLSSPRALVLDHLKFKLSVSCCIYAGLTEYFKLMCACKTQL